MSRQEGYDEAVLLDPSLLDNDMIFFLYYLSKDSFLLELYEVLGPTGIRRMVEVFGGMQITIPSKVEMKLAVRDFDIYRTLNAAGDDSVLHAQSVKDLSDRYSIKETSIRNLRDRVKASLNHLETTDLASRLRRLRTTQDM